MTKKIKDKIPLAVAITLSLAFAGFAVWGGWQGWSGKTALWLGDIAPHTFHGVIVGSILSLLKACFAAIGIVLILTVVLMPMFVALSDKEKI